MKKNGAKANVAKKNKNVKKSKNPKKKKKKKKKKQTNSPSVANCTGAYNGICESQYNVAACSFDGGDCDSFNTLYPDCDVELPYWVGDGICDGPSYNSTECGFDGGDCAYYNSTFNNSTNTTNVSLDTTARRLFELILDFFYPKPDDEVLDWQK